MSVAEPLDVRLVCSLLCAAGQASRADDAFERGGGCAPGPLAAHALASVLLAVCGARAGRSRLLRCAAAAVSASLPDAAVVRVRCGRASAAVAAAPRAPPAPAARWLACAAHEELLARAAPALVGSPVLARAHAAVAAARARAPARACAVLVDDADCLDGGGGGGDDDEACAACHGGALCGQAALAVLACVWQCPACLACGGATHGADAAGAAAGSVALLLTASSLDLISRAHFLLPRALATGAVALAPSVRDDWLPGALRAAAAGGAALAAAAEREPARMALDGLAAAAAATDPALAAAAARLAPPRACAVVDVACELLPPPAIRARALSWPPRGGAGDVAALCAAAFLPPDEGEDADDCEADGAPVPLWARSSGADADADAAASAPQPGRDRASPWESLVIGGAAKAELHRSVVLPLLAWQAQRRLLGGIGAALHAPPEVRAMADAMAALRVSPPSGVLLHGPPGCGKTTAAAALARACRMRLLVVDAGLMLAKYVGDSEAGVRALFRLARRASPCCLVIENFHIVGGARALARADDDGGGGGGAHGAASVHDRLLATLLTELDGVGIKRSEGGGGGGGGGGEAACVLTVGITEHESDIDAALLRAGRLGVRVALPPPDADGRAALLARFAADAAAAPQRAPAPAPALPGEDDLRALAAAARGCSGASLRLWAALAADAADAAGRAAPTVADFAATAPAAESDDGLSGSFAALRVA